MLWATSGGVGESVSGRGEVLFLLLLWVGELRSTLLRGIWLPGVWVGDLRLTMFRGIWLPDVGLWRAFSGPIGGRGNPQLGVGGVLAGVSGESAHTYFCTGEMKWFGVW